MLTVAQEGIERIRDRISEDTAVDELFRLYLLQMKDTLNRTPEMLEILDGDVVENKEAVLCDRMVGVDADKTGCWYPCVTIDEPVKKGQKIGEIRDYFGNLLAEYTSPADGVCVYVIRSLAINEGDPLFAAGTM